MKLYIRQTPSTLRSEVYLIEEAGKKFGDIGYYLTADDKSFLVATTLPPRGTGSQEDQPKPFIIVEDRVLRGLLQAFADYLKAQGMEAESESKAKGKLEAMGAHLEDMRALIFKKRT